MAMEPDPCSFCNGSRTPLFQRAGGKKRAVRKIHQRAMLAEAPAGLAPTEKPAQAKRDQWTWNTAEEMVTIWMACPEAA